MFPVIVVLSNVEQPMQNGAQLMSNVTGYNTAIKRSRLSAPAKWLKENGLVTSNHLDYGCGRGDDAMNLGCLGYDPHWFPVCPNRFFNSITCTYVLNATKKSEEINILKSIKELLHGGGFAYITVRRDIKKNQNGKTGVGKFQRWVELDLPIIKKTSSYVIYKAEKNEL